MSSKSFWTRRSGPPKQSSRDGARPASRRSTRFPGLVLVAGVALALTLPLIAIFDFQRITPNPLSQTKPAGAGQSVSITYNYTASVNIVSGFGLRVHYDSSRLTLNDPNGVTALFLPADGDGPDFTFGPSTPQDDTGNEDADNSTDKVILIAWAHTGASGGGFPGGSLPKTLFTINFTTTAGYTAATRVNVSSIDTAQGFEFQGQSSLISPPGANTPTPLPPTPTATPNAGGDAMLDVDADGETSAFGDGLLIIKHLIGLTGSNLNSGNLIDTVNCTAPRCDAAGVAAYIESIRPQLDVDLNGATTPFSDGLLTIKGIIGLTGTNLTSGGLVDQTNCQRCSAEAIGAYIDDMQVP